METHLPLPLKACAITVLLNVIFMSALPAPMSMHYMYAKCPQGPEVLHALDQELQKIVSCQVGAEN